MKRLTRLKRNDKVFKAPSYCEIHENMYYYESKSLRKDILNKLGKLEDIEEELGIDLITLFRMLKDGFYINTETGVLFIQNVEQWEKLKQYNEFTSQYGKTWALTKEELK